MKGVWGLFEGEAYEGEWLLGVFTTRKLALEAKQKAVEKYIAEDKEWHTGELKSGDHWISTRYLELNKS